MTYKDVPKDENGWADASQYLPHQYDLVHLKLSDGTLSKGWRTKSCWDGRKFKPKVEILAWKKADDLVLE